MIRTDRSAQEFLKYETVNTGSLHLLRGQEYTGRQSTFEVYSVSLADGTHQGYRAKTVYAAPEVRDARGRLITPSVKRTIEVTTNGPGLSKARDKLTRAISQVLTNPKDPIVSTPQNRNRLPKRRKRTNSWESGSNWGSGNYRW